jgi:putative transposase
MREEQDHLLAEQIINIHKRYPYYGYRRLGAELKAKGQVVNHKRIKRVMAKYGIFTTIPRSFKVTTQSRHSHRRYKNLMNKVKLKHPDQAWGTDFTYIRISGGFVYLAIILDLYSRKVVGWALGKRLNTELAIAALNRAISLRNPQPGCIHHSDQGVQYCGAEYTKILKEHGILISMSRTGNPYDNAKVESFMRTIKMEEVYLTQYRTFEDVLERVPKFIEDVYNKRRLHSSLGYQSPVNFEAQLN